MTPKKAASWQEKGTKQVTIELSIEAWDKIVAVANDKTLKPSQIIRLWLNERLAKEATESL